MFYFEVSIIFILSVLVVYPTLVSFTCVLLTLSLCISVIGPLFIVWHCPSVLLCSQYCSGFLGLSPANIFCMSVVRIVTWLHGLL